MVSNSFHGVVNSANPVIPRHIEILLTAIARRHQGVFIFESEGGALNERRHPRAFRIHALFKNEVARLASDAIQAIVSHFENLEIRQRSDAPYESFNRVGWTRRVYGERRNSNGSATMIQGEIHPSSTKSNAHDLQREITPSSTPYDEIRTRRSADHEASDANGVERPYDLFIGSLPHRDDVLGSMYLS